jgi:hypothetical protein
MCRNPPQSRTAAAEKPKIWSEHKGYQQDLLLEVTALTVICRSIIVDFHPGNAGLKFEVRHSAHLLINILPGFDETSQIHGVIQRWFTPDVGKCTAPFGESFRQTKSS